jgi:hypothetical protein
MGKNSGILRTLWFLNYAGIGLFRYDANFPLSAPNYPEESQKMRAMVIHCPCSADVGAFKPGQLQTRIIDNALCVSGIAVDIVAGVSDATSAGYFSHGSFAGYIRQLTARYPVYKTGIPMFMAFYYIFMAETFVKPNTSRIRTMAFLINIFCNIYVGSSVTSLHKEFRINPRWVFGDFELAGLAGDALGAELERHLSKYRDIENSFTRIDFDLEFPILRDNHGLC